MKFLEDVGYDGPRHFDAHAYRTEDYDGVKRLRARLHADVPDPQGARRALECRQGDPGAAARGNVRRRAPPVDKYSTGGRDALLAENIDRVALASRGLGYEKLDQLTMEVLLGGAIANSLRLSTSASASRAASDLNQRPVESRELRRVWWSSAVARRTGSAKPR